MADSHPVMREQIVVQRNDSPMISVSSLTRTGTTATVITTVPHGYLDGDYVTIAGAGVVGYNGKWKIVSVSSAMTFTFTCSSSFTSPATGTITVAYTSNAQGGVGEDFWRTLDTLPAEFIPLMATERLQLLAMNSTVTCRFRIRSRSDLTPAMRVLWQPTAPAGARRQTLSITGILPMDDGRVFQYLEAAQVAA